MKDGISKEEVERILKEYMAADADARMKINQQTADRLRRLLLEKGLEHAAEVHGIKLTDEDRKALLHKLDPDLFP